MAWRRYIKLFFLGIIVFSAVLLYIIYFVDPERGLIAFGSFFLSFFLLLVSLFTIIGFYLRKRISNNEVLYMNLKTAFRQGTLVGLYGTLLLVMQAAQILNIWDAVLLAVIIIVMDLFFKGRT